MRTEVTVTEFLAVLNEALKTTLKKDFGDKPAHIVDLTAQTASQIEAIFQFIYPYSGLPKEKK